MKHSLSAFQILQRQFISHSLISLILLFSDYDDKHNPWDVPRSVLNNIHYIIFISSTLIRIPPLKNYSIAQMFVSRLSGGETNDTFRIKIKNGDDVVLRLPKASVVQKLIARESESINVRVAAQLGLNLELLWQDPVNGYQLTRFLKDSHAMNVQSVLAHLPLVLNQLRILHHAPERNLFFHNTVDIFERNNQWLEQVKKPWPPELCDALPTLSHAIEKIKTTWIHRVMHDVPCHVDPVPSNFLLLETQDQLTCRLIDFEYAGNVRGGDIVDIAYLSLCFPPNMTSQLIKQYLDAPSYEFESCVEIIQPVLLYWLSLWYFVSVTEQVDRETKREYLHDAKQFLKRTLNHINSSQFSVAINYLSEMNRDSNLKM